MVDTTIVGNRFASCVILAALRDLFRWRDLRGDANNVILVQIFCEAKYFETFCGAIHPPTDVNVLFRQTSCYDITTTAVRGCVQSMLRLIIERFRLS